MTAAPCAHVPLWNAEGNEAIEAIACVTGTGGLIVGDGTDGIAIYGGVGSRLGLDWRFDQRL